RVSQCCRVSASQARHYSGLARRRSATYSARNDQLSANGYPCRPGTRTTLSGRRQTAVNTYVRPGRTLNVVDVDRDALGGVELNQELLVVADTDSTRRPVHTG